MITKEIQVGSDKLLLSEISTFEELESKTLYRNSWKATHHLLSTVDDEGERLACCAFSVKKVNDKDMTPLESFEYLLGLPKKSTDQIRIEFTNMNDVNNFFDIVAKMVASTSENASSSKNTGDSTTSKQATSPKGN
jgi:molecular chaperone DnaK (HSP70)